MGQLVIYFVCQTYPVGRSCTLQQYSTPGKKATLPLLNEFSTFDPLPEKWLFILDGGHMRSGGGVGEEGLVVSGSSVLTGPGSTCFSAPHWYWKLLRTGTGNIGSMHENMLTGT